MLAQKSKGTLMESHPYDKTRGEGVPSTITLTPGTGLIAPQTEADETALCRHVDGRGHRCRMLVMSPTATLCSHHAQRRLQTQRGSEAAAELLARVSDFSDAASVNRFLGNLVKQVTLKRIPRRDAITLAYICQLLLNSLGAINREDSLRLEESRLAALSAAKLPPKIIWDIPGPPYEPPDPIEAALANKASNDECSRR